MVQFGRELDQQQLDALDIGLDEHPEQIGGGMPLFEFDFLKNLVSPNSGRNQRRINKDIAPH